MHTGMAVNNPRYNISLTEESPRFFWVNHEQGKSQENALARCKQSFLKSKHYEDRRNRNTQRSGSWCQRTPILHNPLHARSDSGLANQASDDINNLKDLTVSGQEEVAGTADSSFSHESVISVAPTIRIIDNLPSSPDDRADKSDIYFHHYRLQTSKSSWPIDFQDISIWFWQKTYDHPALGHVILSTSASQLAAVLRLQNASPTAIGNATKDALLFRSQSIKLLQQMLDHIPRASLESTILIVAHLTCIEAAEANIVAVDAHIHGLKKLVDMAGGLDTLGNKTISTVYCCEVMRGVISSAPPVFRISETWATRVLSQCTFLATADYSTILPLLGTRFFNSPWSNKIFPELLSILQSLQEFISYYERQLFKGSAWHSLGNDYLIILMLRLYKPVIEGSHVEFQESLRLSTIAYCMIRVWKSQGCPCLEVLSNNLRQSLDYSYAELHLAAPDLLFWILFTGALASQTPPISSSHIWFLERLAELANELYLVDWDNAAHLLQGYFFPRSHDMQAKSLWESVIRYRNQMLQRDSIRLSQYH